MKTMRIKTQPAYRIFIEPGLLQRSGEMLKDLFPSGTRVAIISSESPAKYYREDLEKSLKSAGFECRHFTVPLGEKEKSLDTVSKLYDELINAGLDRSSCILALGGGRVGDIAGFCAATLYRGIAFVQIPSTLLAQVDASVGGKTGVNHEKGKNLIGAFYQPKMVLIDPVLLKTLDMRERVSGFAEVLKYGFIADAALLESCITNKDKILQMQDMHLLQDIVCRCLRIKAGIVEKDERESGLRMLLNFGHSIGHALERSGNYSLRHGEALLLGMDAALRLSSLYAGLNSEDQVRFSAFLRDLPIDAHFEFVPKKLIEYLRYDKKSKDQKPLFVLLRAVGKAHVHRDISEEKLLEVLRTMQ